MPGSAAAGDIIEVTFVGEADAQSVYNVMHYQVDPGITGGSISVDSMINALTLGWEENVVPQLSETYEFKEGRAQQIISVVNTTPPTVEPCPAPPFQYEVIYGSWGVDYPAAPVALGGIAGPALPTYGAIACTKRSEKRGKYWRGAMRLGPVAEASTEADDQNKLVNLYEKDVETAMATFLLVNSVIPGGEVMFKMVIFSKTRAARFAGEAMSESASLVTGINTRELVTSQVSRKRVRRVL